MLLLDRPYQEWECKPIICCPGELGLPYQNLIISLYIDGITLDTGQYRANLAGCEARPLLKADMNAINDDQPKILIVYL